MKKLIELFQLFEIHGNHTRTDWNCVKQLKER